MRQLLAVCPRDKVREDIARDRAEREAQQRRTKELPAPVAAEPVSKPAVKKEYDSCRLQVRVRRCCVSLKLAHR